MDAEVVDHPAQSCVVIRGRTSMPELSSFFDDAFGELGTLMQRGVVTPVGPAFAVYLSPPGEPMEVAAGFPVAAPVSEGRVEPWTLPGGRVARLVHRGSYDGLGAAWEELMGFVGAQGLTPTGPGWESYVDEPGTVPAEELVTEVMIPVA